MKYKNIVVSGGISTGKSTLARNLATHFGWKYVSAGAFFREWHEKNNISLDEPDKIPPEVDRDIDMGFQEKMKNEPNVVFECHLGGWLAKDLDETYKVLCITDDETRIERLAARDQISLSQAEKSAHERAFTLYAKFKKLYGVDRVFDEKYFNQIVDTSVRSKEEVLADVLAELEV